ncbi:MAG: adenylosuccinate synthase [Methanimicrococcus sp.]|nr:adenylosuccinate synthase [Methanimicrococcus sp.]
MFTIITGAQFGDEGKGKVVDYLTNNNDYDIVARFKGGNNDKHTVVIDGEAYQFHQIPSGVLVDKISLIGPGVVLNPFLLMDELDSLKKRNIEISGENFGIDFQAGIIMPYHIAMNALVESAQKKRGGVSKNGIPYAYVDRILKYEFRLVDLFDEDVFYEKLNRILPARKELISKLGGNPYNLFSETEAQKLLSIGETLQDFAVDTSYEINNFLRAGKKVLAEGIQGTMTDVLHGTHPHVSPSLTVAGSACTGLGVGPSKVSKTIGVLKSYTTRAGDGPLPTEQKNEIGRHLEEKGHEYNPVTGRENSCGWLDMCLLKKSIDLNGYTELVLTKLDVLSGLDTVKICAAYELDGERIDYPPPSAKDLERCIPIYGDEIGWDEPLEEIRQFSDLPYHAREFVEYIEKISNVPISHISVGPKREQMIPVDINRKKDTRCNPV